MFLLLMHAPFAVASEKKVIGHKVVGSGSEYVIVLHDWMGDSSNYESAIPWLDSENHTYIFADVRGYGMSADIPGEYNSDEVASDVFALSHYLGIDRFHLVGHSMNGLAGFKAIMLDWKNSKRIKSYIAVTPVTPDGYPASDDDKAFLLAAIADDKTAVAAFGALTGGKLSAKWSSAKTHRNRASSSVGVLGSYYKMWLEEDFADALQEAQIKTPVLVIGGRNDLAGFQERHYRKTLAQWLPEISFEFIENSGHYPMEETPVLFASLVEKHIDSNVD